MDFLLLLHIRFGRYIFYAFLSPGTGSGNNKILPIAFLYLGLFPTVIPYLALVYVTSRVGASEATSSLYLTPALTFVIAWVWLGEVPTTVSVIG